MAEIHWVDTGTKGRIAIMARPWGGDWLEDEVRQFAREGVEVVVSHLESHEVKELSLEREAEACRAAGIEFLSHPIRDHDVPKHPSKTDPFIRTVAERFRKGRRVVVHCRAGIGRSGTIAACVLLENGIPKEEVFQKLAEARGMPIPGTPEQWEWVESFARRRDGATTDP